MKIQVLSLFTFLSFDINKNIGHAFTLNHALKSSFIVDRSPLDAIHSHSSIRKNEIKSRKSSLLTQMSLDSSIENDSTTNENNENNNIWNPQLRRVMGTLSGIGMIETAYLTFVKLTSAEPVLCSTGGSCGDVLNGPYASVGDIPLSAFGLAGM